MPTFLASITNKTRHMDFVSRRVDKKNSSGVVAPIEMYDDPLDPSKVKMKTKKLIYGFSMGLHKPNRTYNRKDGHRK